MSGKVLSDVRYHHLPAFRKHDRSNLARRERFLQFIRSSPGDAGVARELEEFVRSQCGTSRRADRLEALLQDLDRQQDRLYHDMEGHNADFQALEQLEKHEALFSAEEHQELKSLFGSYGLEMERRLPAGQVSIEYAAARQQHWMDIRLCSRETVRRDLAERAEARYGSLLHALLRSSPGAPPSPR
jgi:hypothetical protein